MKLLHFADAHIDMANYGRHDPETGLPLRVLDFLKSLDTIVDAALNENVDMVIFAGDTYKDRSPAPTFQREWGRRIIRLSQAGIPTFLLVGNHDMSPAVGRANSVQEFDTLQIPHVRVLQKPEFLSAEELGLPVQIIAIPYVSRSGLVAALEIEGLDKEEVYSEIENRLTELIIGWLDNADKELPVILTAHASVQGAAYGSERTVMLGSDLVLPASIVKDKRLDYVALGHIHKPQDLNEGAHPPVIYPGSIERVDFGEAADKKYFVIAEVTKGQTQVDWKNLDGIRPFIDCRAVLTSDENVTETLIAALPKPKDLEGAILRLMIEYPREWDPLIDDGALRQYAENSFEFHLVKRPQVEARIRLPENQTLGSLSPLELLDQYWRANHTENAEVLQKLARDILSGEEETD
ncbi:MAG: exonuclease SbcCD subunit D [Anaerolineae bacterium]|nr:exonuclease SbcCD subunit D [Anaerolineae bacterium]